MNKNALDDYDRLVQSIFDYDHHPAAQQEDFSFWVQSYRYLTELPHEISFLHRLHSLHIQNCTRLQYLPTELGDLPQLHTLQITTIKQLPKGLGQLANIHTLLLSDSLLLKSTNWNRLLPLTNLRTLHVSNCLNNWANLPMQIFKLTNLEALHLPNNQITTLPQEIQQLQALKTLDLSYNPLSSFPAFVLQLPALQTLVLPASAIANFTSSSLGLQHIANLTITDSKQVNKTAIRLFLQLLRYSKKHAYSNALQQLILDTIRDKKQLRTYTKKKLFLLLDSHLSVLQSEALEQLENKLLPPHSACLFIAKGSKIIVQGNLKGSLSALQLQLAEQGWQLGKKVTATTQYILIGTKPNRDKWQKIAPKATLLTEKMLLAHLQQLHTPYLLASANENTTEQLQNITQLLLSADNSNVLLVIDLLQAGGIPFSLQEAIFWAYRQQSSTTIRRKLKQLASVHFSVAFVQLLQSKKRLQANLSEKQLAKNLAFFVQAADLDAVKMAAFCYQLLQKGYWFISQHLSQPQQEQFTQLTSLSMDEIRQKLIELDKS